MKHRQQRHVEAEAVQQTETGATLAFTVLGPPVGKARARIVYREAMGIYKGYTPDKTRAVEGEIGYMAQGLWEGKPPLEGPVALMVKFYFPIPRSWSQKRQALALNGELLPIVKPDVDNCVKLVKDALSMIVWRNDAQVVLVTGAKFYSDRPRTEIVVKVLERPGAQP